MQFAAAQVGGAAQIESRIHPGDSETDFGESVAPWTAEGVGYHHRDGDAESPAHLVAQEARRRVGILGQQNRGVVFEAVGFVDSRVGADPSGAGLDDNHAVIVAHDSAGLAKHNLDRTRIFFPSPGEVLGELGRFEIFQIHRPALGLGNYLLANDKDVAGFEAKAGSVESAADERGEIVARFYHRDVLDRDETYRAHRSDQITIPQALAEPLQKGARRVPGLSL